MAFGPTRRADTPKILVFAIEPELTDDCRGRHAALRGGRARSAEHDVEVEVVDAPTRADRFALIVVERFHRDGEIVEIRRCECLRLLRRARPFGSPDTSGSTWRIRVARDGEGRGMRKVLSAAQRSSSALSR